MSIGVPVESSFRWRQSGPQIRVFDCFRLNISHILKLIDFVDLHRAPMGSAVRMGRRNLFAGRRNGSGAAQMQKPKLESLNLGYSNPIRKNRVETIAGP
jgi:hypothetical protein